LESNHWINKENLLLETEATKEAVRTKYAELAIIAAEGVEEGCCGGSSCANRAITPPPRYRAAGAIP